MFLASMAGTVQAGGGEKVVVRGPRTLRIAMVGDKRRDAVIVQSL